MKYRVSRTATVHQYVDVEMPEGSHEDDIIDEAFSHPWHTGKTYDSEGCDVEELRVRPDGTSARKKR